MPDAYCFISTLIGMEKGVVENLRSAGYKSVEQLYGAYQVKAMASGSREYLRTEARKNLMDILGVTGALILEIQE